MVVAQWELSTLHMLRGTLRFVQSLRAVTPPCKRHLSQPYELLSPQKPTCSPSFYPSCLPSEPPALAQEGGGEDHLNHRECRAERPQEEE